MGRDKQKSEKRLSELGLEVLERYGIWSQTDPIILGLSCDSKKVEHGFIFFAISGLHEHGAKYACDAVKRGAILIVTDLIGVKFLKEKSISLATVIVQNPRKSLSVCSARIFYKQPMNQVAITGTNGKTSVSVFVRQIWEELGLKAVNIGTLGVQGAVEKTLIHTTPEPITLHKTLTELVEFGVQHASLEASSHGLEQWRLDGVVLQAAAFTNLSRDHLDYHHNQKKYLEAKCLLFDRVLPIGKIVVLNFDDPNIEPILAICDRRHHQVIKVGYKSGADIQICDQRFYPDGQIITFSYLGNSRTIKLSLIGDFQAMNILMAATLVIALGAEPNKVFDSLPNLHSVPGRMYLVDSPDRDVNVYVDYAHTPDALSKSLKALRLHTIGNLIVVFGAGGDRDSGKRSLMGQVAEELADKAIVTDDNPRTESAANIRRDIIKFCPSAVEIPDRAEAILVSIKNLEKGDVLLIAGKGHESGQIIGEDIYPFSDVEMASLSLSLRSRESI